MTDTSAQDRRDWFRLQLNDRNAVPQHGKRTSSMGQSSAGMTPIARPENHDGLDLTQLPPMREAILSGSDVEQLFADIESCASDVLLMQRTTRGRRATASRADTSTDLHAACNTILTAQVSRLQIRYQWQGQAWIDTLECHPNGYRLVRIVHTAALPG